MKSLLISLSLLFYAATSSTALACSCVAPGGYFVSEFVEDKIIFEGRVLSSKWLGDAPENDFVNSETRFGVSEGFWNVSNNEVILSHYSDGAGCGMAFPMGHETLIIAYKQNQNRLETDGCTQSMISEITLINYFEKGLDVYIPLRSECSEEQIDDPQDPKNCYYLNDESWDARREAYWERKMKLRDESQESIKALTLSNETP